MEENLHLRSSLVEIKTGKKSYVLILLKASIQIALGYLLEWTPNIVSLIFIGHDQKGGGEIEVSALGLGVMWANVFGFGVYTGLAAGLETITAQAYGSKSYHTTSLQFWQCTWIIIVLMIPIGLIMVSSRWVLALLNIEPEVIRLASYVCNGYIYAILVNGFYCMTKGFLNGQYIYGLTLVTQIVTASSHILSCYILIQVLELGIDGAIIARCITETLNLIVIWMAIYFKSCCKDTLQKPNSHSLKGWGEFLKQTVPIGLLYLLEWIGYELYTFQASMLSTSQFAASVIMNNFGSFYYQIAMGISIAASTFIGNSMGANEPKEAQRFSKTGIYITLIFLILTLLPLYFIRTQFTSMFTQEVAVQNEMLDVFYVFCLSMANDSIQVMLTGIVRSIGYEQIACYIFLALYIVVGQANCYLLSQVADLELLGIILATLITVTVYDLIVIVIIFKAKWDEKAIQIQGSYSEKEAKFSLQEAIETNDDVNYNNNIQS